MKDKLIEALKTIGWSARSCGCDMFQVFSHHGKPTEFVFNDYAIWLDAEEVFGKDGRKDRWHTMGVVKFIFEKCEIKIESGFVSVSNDGGFLMFRGKKDKSITK